MLRTDFILYRENGGLAALVESSGDYNMDAHEAARLRCRMLESTDLPDAPFFLIVTPQHVFLWKNAGVEPEVVEPHAILCSERLLARYFAGKDHDPRTTPWFIFRLIVDSWLLILSDPASEDARAAHANGLGELADMLRWGTVRARDAA